MNTFSHHVHGVRVIHMKFKTRSNALKISNVNFVCTQRAKRAKQCPFFLSLSRARSAGLNTSSVVLDIYMFLKSIHEGFVRAGFFFLVSFIFCFIFWYNQKIFARDLTYGKYKEKKQTMFVFGVCYHRQHLRFRIIRSGCE